MSFWRFLGGFFLFNYICDLFSGHRSTNHFNQTNNRSDDGLYPYDPYLDEMDPEDRYLDDEFDYDEYDRELDDFIYDNNDDPDDW